jgi:UDP-N-acetylglucosamine 2-epimerase (non-hydrolysing)
VTPSVLVVAGTRPEWQKLATVILGLRAAGVPTAFLWTSQHSDPAMTSAFAEGLGWPEPDGWINWNTEAPPSVPPGLIAHRLRADGLITHRLRAVRRWWRETYGDAPPALVLVQGDTDSASVGARAFYGLTPCVAHLEAGLRSWEPDLPEERNRREIDRLADLLLCPSTLAAAHAKVDAKVGAQIVVTGQTGLDALVAAIECTPSPPPVSPPYALLTLHRAALADDPEALGAVVLAARRAARRSGLALLWPVHPRVAGRQASMIDAVRDLDVSVIEPLSYRDMAARLAGHDRPAVVISDSGGLVEESCYLGIPTVIVRPATERWELVARGDADLVRPADAAERLPDVVAAMIKGVSSHLFLRTRASPYGRPDGRVGTPTARAVEAIVKALAERP